MGLIREPRNIDFYVIEKVWSDKELKDFSEFIKQLKSQKLKKKLQRNQLTTALS